MILTYHRVLPQSNDNLTVTVKRFRQHLTYLQENNKTVVFLDDYESDNENQVVLRFDDGTKDTLQFAAPILNEFGFPFEVFICGDFVQEKNTQKYCNTADLQELLKYGGRLQYHSKSHKKLNELPESALESEIRCPDELKALDPKGFRWFAYPYWRWNETVISVVQKYFKGGASAEIPLRKLIILTPLPQLESITKPNSEIL
jgi:peptidoglycan/xylan/chitin deacetylase (PgdA/CDA1 family)